MHSLSERKRMEVGADVIAVAVAVVAQQTTASLYEEAAVIN